MRLEGCEAAACDPDAVQRELEAILSSRTFRSARGQKEFLRYTVGETIAGRAHLLKEYAIGMEAFGRGESFDPRLDPIVRTQARKLRAKLQAYYETEGASNSIRIELRRGSYVPVFSAAGAQNPANQAIAAPMAATTHPEPIREDEVAFIPARSRRSWPGVFTLPFIALLACMLVIAYLIYSRSHESAVLAENSGSVAVMPLVNINDLQEDEFLSDGLTEELIDSLGQVPGLRVVGRTSSFHFKGKALNVREIGRRLNAGAVLQGGVRITGKRLRVAVQLNSTADGYHLWSGSYSGDVADARTIQWEIARAVADVLEARLVRGSERDLRKAFPNLSSPAPGAYQNYLRGLYFFNKLTAEGLQTAIQYLQESISEDPSFARAYSALADCYVMEPQVAAVPSQAILPTIRSAAAHALELDNTLGEAHIDLAICAEYEFDWETAGKEFQRGLELNPQNAVGHLWYAKYLALLGRKAEVLIQRKTAAELDPVSPYAIQSVGGYLSVMGRYDDAINEFRNALAVDPNFGLTHQGLGVAYLLKGKPDEGIAELQLACRLMDGPRRLALLGWAYAVSGKTGEAHHILDSFLRQAGREPFPALAVAEIYIGLRDKDRAFEWLAKAAEQKDLNMDLKWDSFYEPLRSDSRYVSLLRRMKLT